MVRPFPGAPLCVLMAVLALQATSGAAEELHSRTPEMITQVRVLTDEVSPAVRQVLPDSQSEWQRFSQAAETAFKAGNFGESQRQLIAAAKNAQAANPTDRRLALSAYNLGVWFEGRGQFQRAEPCYERALKELTKLKGAEDHEVMLWMSRLAQFYLVENKITRADPLTARLLATLDKKLPDEQQARSSLNNLSQFYQRHPEYTNARALFNQLDENMTRRLSTDHLELAVSMDNLGLAYKARSRYVTAEKLLKLALSTRQLTLPADHAAMAASYSNLAGVYIAQGKYSQAEPLLKQALEVQQKRNGVAGDQLAVINDLATCYCKQGLDAKAESLYEQYLPLIEKNSGAGNPEFARALSQLGALYKRQGKYEQAEPVFKRALAICEAANGPQHSSLVPMLEDYADILRRTNKTQEASKQLARARSIK